MSFSLVHHFAHHNGCECLDKTDRAHEIPFYVRNVMSLYGISFVTVYLCSSVFVLVAVCCSVTMCMVIIAQFELLQLMVSVHARVRVELRRNSSWKHCASAFSFLLWQIAIENYPSLTLSVCACVDVEI